MELAEEHCSGMGTFSRTFETEPFDEVIQNEVCKYLEVDRRFFEEKLVARDSESGRHESSSRSGGQEDAGTESDSTDDDPLRHHHPVGLPDHTRQACGRRLSRRPPRNRKVNVSAASTRLRKSYQKTSKSRHHSLASPPALPGTARSL